MLRGFSAALCSASVLAMCFAIALPRAQAAEPEALAENSEWSGVAQLAAGYDTNANASTQQQAFFGFLLDPHFTETDSSFGELTLGVNHTAALADDRGFNSFLQVALRANPEASFANQTLASIGTEAVLLRGAARFTLGVSTYGDRLDGQNHERAGSIDFGVSRQGDGNFELSLSLRASRIGYGEADYEALDADRYLAGVSVTRVNLGTGAGSIGITLLGARDAARRTGSPFGNNRIGAQLSMSWPVHPAAVLYAELSGVRSDYAGGFFDLRRADAQSEATMALEFSDMPARRWSVMPQLRYVRNDSTVPLYEYDRIEAALYVRRQF
jgi:hypothetical protein